MSARKPGHLLWGIYALAVVVLTAYAMAFVLLALWLHAAAGSTPPTHTL